MRVDVEEDPLCIIISFIDQGTPFNPLTKEMPDTTGMKARERPIGGLGLFMVKQTMDGVAYAYEDGKNILTIRKKTDQITGGITMSETIYQKQGTTLTVKPEGRLDTVTSPALEKELQEHLDGVKDVTMDLAAVEYISSGGLRMMLATEQLLEQKGGALKVINANEYILEVFDLVGFMDVVEVVRS